MKELPTKEFVKQMKLYFSSLSARGAKYLFLNIPGFENKFILSNGDYEMITAYAPVILSFHIITFKDASFYTQFLQFMNFTLDCPYVIRISQILKALKDNKFEELDVVYDDHSKMKIILIDKVIESDENSEDESESGESEESEEGSPASSETEDEDLPFKDTSKYVVVTFASADVCGQPIDNLYAMSIMEDCLREIYQVPESVKSASVPHYFYDLDIEIPYFHGNYFRFKLNLPELFKSLTKEDLDFPANVHMVIIDGMDVPSVKEFVKKQPEAKTRFLVWSTNEKTIRHLALYEDPVIDILSVRPFHQMVIPKITR